MNGALFTILLAEDDANDALLIKRAFAKNGIQNPIQVVCDGEEAISYLTGAEKFADRSKHPFPHFLITDLKMPRKSGFEVLAWLSDHAECGIIPTVVLSSSRQPDDIRKAYQLHANSYFVKPAEFSELQILIRKIFEYWTSCEKPEIARG